MTADTVGGVWTYALDLGRELVAANVRVTLATLGPDPNEDQCAKAAAAGLVLEPLGGALDWTADEQRAIALSAVQLANLCKKLRPDLLHLNSPALAAFNLFETSLLVGCHSCVKTWWLAVKGHAPLPDDLAWRVALVGLGYANADALVAPSQTFADATTLAYGLIAAPKAIPNGRSRSGVVKASPAALENQTRERLSYPADLGCAASIPVAKQNDVFTAGRLWDAAKDVMTLDRGVGLSGLRGLAAGPLNGPNGETIALAHLQPLGQLSEAQLGGHLVDRPIFVAPSLYEPFGLAVLEAAQAGCPLVLSDISTFRELWDGVAVFFPAGDDVVLANVLRELAGDSATRLRWGDAARSRATRYSAAAMAKATIGLYATLNPTFALEVAA